ncbi:MAG: hypothetical protein OEO20_08970 [Gemmatimonadota bacterium]|nr:hypothetical protein [Gemmatimonadota bacterium]MDH3367636.1 hypothetical protein [Gemmatimonadota bacterium]MDH3478421.1 hypothetical protein [Gemmatimonadota bacterium]MDH3568758.1 hypothetical protein [Gemmatimonadota bacterium]MDH5549383.1 hypothetical protein [Gemmatimonadota bacterium]
MMRSAAALLLLCCLTSCMDERVRRLRSLELSQAGDAIALNIAAIQRRDVEAYLAGYLDSPDLIVAGADSLRRGYFLFAEARRASEEWPDALTAGEPTLVWIAPGVVWGAFEFAAVAGSDTARGWSERLVVKTSQGWKIAVTGTMQR